jgi:hypothetical protein
VTVPRETLPIFLLACACGASFGTAPAASAPLAAPASKPALVLGDDEDPAALGPRGEALRARGAAIAAGMRLAAQRRSTDAEIDLLRADSQDECVRVAYDADEPIVARLTNAKGDVLARADAPASFGILPAAGPVCVRKGDAIAAVALRSPDSPPDASTRTRVLWATWAAP